MSKVTATTDGKRILVNTPYGYNKEAKLIPGHRASWDKTVTPNRFKYWTYPLSMGTCYKLREVFGDNLEVLPALIVWSRDELARLGELEELRSGVGTNLPVVREAAPKLWQALKNRPFQINGAAFLLKGKNICLGDEPRLGKTYQTLAALVESGAHRILIACPRTATRTVWARKIAELTPTITPFVAQGDHKQREHAMGEFFTLGVRQDGTVENRAKALIVNLEMIREVRKWQCPSGVEWRVRPGLKNGCQYAHEHKTVYYPDWPFLHNVLWDAIVLDECHHALASDKNVQSGNITQIRLGAVHLKTHETTLKIALSGTPFRSKLKNAWGILNWCRPDVFSSFWRFAEEQFEVTNDGYSTTVSAEPRDMAAFDAALRPYYLARTKAEVAPWLNPVQYEDVWLDMEPKQAKAYDQMAKLASAQIEGGQLNANGVLAELMRLKQFATTTGKLSPSGKWSPSLPSIKFDWLIQFLDERRDVAGKVVVVSQFTKLVNLFADELRNAGWPVVTITGESSDAQREHAQDEFKKITGPRVAVINVFAGGEAIDLSAADELVFLDEPWTADTIEQAENRIQNLAKTSQLTVYRLRATDTVEAWISELTAEQRELLATARPEALALAKEAVA